jgi:hypothetical protein
MVRLQLPLGSLTAKKRGSILPLAPIREVLPQLDVVHLPREDARLLGVGRVLGLPDDPDLPAPHQGLESPLDGVDAHTSALLDLPLRDPFVAVRGRLLDELEDHGLARVERDLALVPALDLSHEDDGRFDLGCLRSEGLRSFLDDFRRTGRGRRLVIGVRILLRLLDRSIGRHQPLELGQGLLLQARRDVKIGDGPSPHGPRPFQRFDEAVLTTADVRDLAAVVEGVMMKAVSVLLRVHFLTFRESAGSKSDFLSPQSSYLSYSYTICSAGFV